MTTTHTTETPTTLKAGDILVSSWGYDQTNVDHYLVVRATKSSVWLVDIGCSTVEGSEDFMCDSVTPDPDLVLCGYQHSRGQSRCGRTQDNREHHEGDHYWGETELHRHDYDQAPHMHRWRAGYNGEPSVTIDSGYRYAHLYRGGRNYRSWYA